MTNAIFIRHQQITCSERSQPITSYPNSEAPLTHQLMLIKTQYLTYVKRAVS